MQAKTADEGKMTKPQAVMIPEEITIQPIKTKTIKDYANHISPFKTTGIITPVEQYSETAPLLISRSMSTITDKDVPIRVYEHKRIAIHIEEEHTSCRFHCAHPGTVQIHQTRRHRCTADATK